MANPSDPDEPRPAAPSEQVPSPDDSGPVVRLPRTIGFKVSNAALFRIAMTAAVLVMIVVAQRPCSDAVSGFVTSFDGSNAGSPTQMPKPGTVDVPQDRGSAGDYEALRPGMTEDEIKAAIERARAKAREQATGSAGLGSGSAR